MPRANLNTKGFIDGIDPGLFQKPLQICFDDINITIHTMQKVSWNLYFLFWQDFKPRRTNRNLTQMLVSFHIVIIWVVWKFHSPMIIKETKNHWQLYNLKNMRQLIMRLQVYCTSTKSINYFFTFVKYKTINYTFSSDVTEVLIVEGLFRMNHELLRLITIGVSTIKSLTSLLS